jgi:hypothetical protein
MEGTHHSLSHVRRYFLWVARRLFGDDSGADLVIAQRGLFHFSNGFFHVEWVALGVALVVSIIWTRRNRHGSRIGRVFSGIARRRHLAILLVFLTALVGRIAMLNTNPLPQPRVADEFGYLLAADTYSHFRLTNPTPPLWHHFETIHQFMVPTYMAKFPPGQGLVLALGVLIFHSAAIAVILSSAAMAAALCWQLQDMVPPVWALWGGLLAAIRIGTISYWSDTYWSGSVAAFAGCVLLGSVSRWAKRPAMPIALLAAVSSVLVVASRPFEGALLVMGSLAYLAWNRRRSLLAVFSLGTVAPFAGVVVLAAVAAAINNYVVTGHVALFPYAWHSQQYSITPALLFQKAPASAKVWRNNGQRLIHLVWERTIYDDQRTSAGYVVSLIGEKFGRYGRFFLGPSLMPLLLGIPLALIRRKDRSFLMLLWAVLIVVTLETWTYPHYLAPMLGVIYFLLILSARYLRTWSRARGIGVVLVRAVGLTCFFSLSLRLFLAPVDNLSAPAWEGSAPVDWGRPHVLDRLNQEPGNHLVLVDYRFAAGQINYNEWVFNSADLASQKIIWAHRMEPQESDRDLECFFADRQPWLATVGYVGEGFWEQYSLQKLPRPSCSAAPHQ